MHPELPQRRVLFTPWGNGNGHVMRAVVLAQQATREGLQPVVAVMSDDQRDLVQGHGLTAVEYEDASTGLDPWRVWTDTDSWLTAIGNDRLLLRSLRPDVVVNDSRLSMQVAAYLEGVRLTGIVQDMDFPGYSYPGRDREDLWNDMLPALGAAMSAHGLSRSFLDPREVIVAGGVVVPGSSDSDQLPEGADPRAAFVGPLTGHQVDAQGSTRLVPREGILFYKTLGPESDLSAFCEIFGDLGTRIYVATGDALQAAALEAELARAGMHVEDLWHISEDLDQAPSLAVIHGGHGTLLHMAQAGVPTVVIPDASPERYANAVKADAIPSMMGLTAHLQGSRLSWAAQSVGVPVYDFKMLREAIDQFDLSPKRRLAADLAKRLRHFSIPGAWATIMAVSRVPDFDSTVSAPIVEIH